METQDRITEAQPAPLQNPGAWPEKLPAPTLGERARELGGAARDRARQTAGWLNETTLHYARTQPAAALGIAAGVGVVIGLLTGITQSRHRRPEVTGTSSALGSRDTRDL